MSSNNRNQGGKRSLLVRILCGVLAGLLILSSVLLLIDSILTGHAADGETLAGYAFHSEFRKDHYYVAVSLQWQGNASVSYPFFSPLGLVFGETDVQKNSRSFSPLFLSEETDVVVTCDANLKVWNGACTFSTSDAETNIGGYNVELRLPEDSAPEVGIWDTLPDLTDLFTASYGHVFRAYVNGEKTIRVGAFPNITAATEAAGAISAALEGFRVSVVPPDNQGVTVLNEDCDRILFEYLGPDSRSCAFCPRQAAGSQHFYTAYNNKTYDGVMYFRRDNDYAKLTLDNLVRLPEYLEGVVTGEIYTSWELETIKAFAITANSVIVGRRGDRLHSVGADVVAGSLDQNYNGRSNVVARVIEACEAVSDCILTYTYEDGTSKIVEAAYSSSQGGYAIDSKCAWYSSVGPYVISQPTMWEDYVDVGRGFWQEEVSPTDLCTQVKKTLTGLKGTYITDVSYKTTGEVFTGPEDQDTTYLYSITFTDNLGNKATATRASTINSLMGNYVDSANFVIGKNSVDYWYDDVTANRVIDLSSTYSGNLTVRSAEGKTKTASSLFHFLSKLGIGEKDNSYALYVRSAEGTALLVSELDMPVTTLPDENGMYTYVSDYGDFLIVSSLRHYEGTYTAKTPGNFVIVGKGFGHGVGMSQWGAQHLGKAGARYDHILRAYYPGSEISSFTLWSIAHS